jgi:hypothetical protein
MHRFLAFSILSELFHATPEGDVDLRSSYATYAHSAEKAVRRYLEEEVVKTHPEEAQEVSRRLQEELSPQARAQGE